MSFDVASLFTNVPMEGAVETALRKLCPCLDVGILSPKPNLDHRSFFSLGRYVN